MHSLTRGSEYIKEHGMVVKSVWRNMVAHDYGDLEGMFVDFPHEYTCHPPPIMLIC